MLPDMYDPQQLNRYVYVRNNPLKYTDPTGNMVQIFVVGAGITITLSTTQVILITGVGTYLISCAIDCERTNDTIQAVGGYTIEKVQEETELAKQVGAILVAEGINMGKQAADSTKMALAGLAAALTGIIANNNDNEEDDPRPNEKGNSKKLPTKGKHTYKAPKEKGINQDTSVKKVTGDNGYIDDKGNIWKWDQKGQHWDVQHKNGTHTNVKPNGDIHHGPDNF